MWIIVPLSDYHWLTPFFSENDAAFTQTLNSPTSVQNVLIGCLFSEIPSTKRLRLIKVDLYLCEITGTSGRPCLCIVSTFNPVWPRCFIRGSTTKELNSNQFHVGLKVHRFICSCKFSQIYLYIQYCEKYITSIVWQFAEKYIKVFIQMLYFYHI